MNCMDGTLYRGTRIEAALDQELSDGRVSGRTIDLVSGWMNPDDIDNEPEYRASDVESLPWEDGPHYDDVHLTGGFSTRLGASWNFADGKLPLVFHLDENRVSDATPIQYNYRSYNSSGGHLAWVDQKAGGELRINGDLEGLLNPPNEDGVRTIRYYGDGVRSRSMDYSNELEYVVPNGGGGVDISRAVKAVVCYVTRPMANLTSLDGYSRLDTKLTPDTDEVVKDWSDERIADTLYDELIQRTGTQYPVYLVHVNTSITMELWGFQDRDVDAIYGPGGKTTVSAVPDHILGD